MFQNGFDRRKTVAEGNAVILIEEDTLKGGHRAGANEAPQPGRSGDLNLERHEDAVRILPVISERAARLETTPRVEAMGRLEGRTSPGFQA